MDEIKDNLATVVLMCVGILFSWSVFLFITVIRIVIPFKLRQLFTIPLFLENILHLTQSDLLNDIRSQTPLKRCLSVTIAATHSFSCYFREISVLIIIVHFRQLILDALRDKLFEWIEHIFPSASEPIDEYVDTEPPPLEMDVNSPQTAENKEWLVFDPVLGVIPGELREQWIRQAKERVALRQELAVRRKGQLLPPVRNWHHSHAEEDLGEDIILRAITTDAED